MFSEKDLLQIQSKNIEIATVEQQIQDFKDGFPFMQLEKAATVEDGVIRLSEEDVTKFADLYAEKSKDLDLLKFVPASGAATRMFKSLFTFLTDDKSDKSVEQFFERLPEFAFYKDLIELVPENADRKTIVSYFLTEIGLNYGYLPKGLLKFHSYPEGCRTPLEEHIIEAANYGASHGKAQLHFTVSPEHNAGFKGLTKSILPFYQRELNTTFDISFSEQKASTDTIAVNMDNSPFREKDGSLLFRPAGHGALLENLNDMVADVVFIKNIDNVVPDRIKATTYDYKKALAGILLSFQERIFAYQQQLSAGASSELLDELAAFFEKELCVLPPSGFDTLGSDEKIAYFQRKLNRPIRVCGVVKNTGEPGGGPFWCKNTDGTTSLQIVESAQVDMDNEAQKATFNNSTHFNPVDLICGLKDSQGQKFDLISFRDPKTGFVTIKSRDGKDLKAQELPGLWNGAMADWNTVFVEVPLITFNPVKTVNDLLREEHQ
jgi:hypothetical protein